MCELKNSDNDCLDNCYAVAAGGVARLFQQPMPKPTVALYVPRGLCGLPNPGSSAVARVWLVFARMKTSIAPRVKGDTCGYNIAPCKHFPLQYHSHTQAATAHIILIFKMKKSILKKKRGASAKLAESRMYFLTQNLIWIMPT